LIEKHTATQEQSCAAVSDAAGETRRGTIIWRQPVDNASNGDSLIHFNQLASSLEAVASSSGQDEQVCIA
jgi:hypothetical protein